MRLWWLSGLIVGALLAAPGVASAQVNVFPIPGSRVASPHAQIAFRGVSPGNLGPISVVGSQSGAHSGTFVPDSDGRGTSFYPAQPFAPGEVVTVNTTQDIVGSKTSSYQFTVATPAGGVAPQHWPPAARVRGDVWSFRSRPDLSPARVVVTRRLPGIANGFTFVAPEFGPRQDGPMILDTKGNVVWFKALPGNDVATDFRVQTYHGGPVLTWWEGYVSAGVGVGRDLIYNSAYQQIAVIHAANGISADMHEFNLSRQNTALITATFPVQWDDTVVRGGSKHARVMDAVVQEIDIPTGNVLFEWDSLDHVPVADTYAHIPRNKGIPFDYFHVNAIEQDKDGNLVINGRNTWAAYKVNHSTGAIIWRLGGKHSSFKLAPGTFWAFQHDVRIRANNDLFVTLFDNDAGPPQVHRQSRGIKLVLDLKHMTAHQVSQHAHSPALVSYNQGNYQQLPNRDDFLGWGQQPFMSEYSPSGRDLFDMHFVGRISNYRAYRFNWSGFPATQPAIATSRRGRNVIVYASWNGATHVRSWRVLGGASPTSLKAVGGGLKNGFETAMKVGSQAYVAVQALDFSGHVMNTSPTVKVS
jgi:hypothetical protein